MSHGALSPVAARLELVGVSRRFGSTIALSDVNLRVLSGEIHALVGENGAGKSTLMKILSGAEQPDSGQMTIDGSPYAPSGPAEGRRRGVVMIYQELAQALDLNVAENIFLGAEVHRCGWLRRAEMYRSASKALESLGHGEIDPCMPIHRLAPAARQIVEIARAIALGCRVLILDEPTSSLGRGDSDRLFEVLRSLRDQGLSIIYISHFLEEVCRLSDHLTVIRDGQVIGTRRTREVNEVEISAMMVGRQLECTHARQSRHRGEEVLIVRDLVGPRSRPAGASLVLHRREVLGLAGLVGTGRTELIRCIFGLDAVKSGAICVAGLDGWREPHARWRQGVGMVSEDRKAEGLATSLSLVENITLPGMCRRGFGWISPAALARESQYLVDQLSLKCRSVHDRVSRLSGGNQQKVAIARLLHARADVFLLDEPTRGIDVGSKAAIYRIIDQLASGDMYPGRPPAAVLIVSSYLPELLTVCDRIAVMNRGRICAVHDARSTTEHAIMLAATAADEVAA